MVKYLPVTLALRICIMGSCSSLLLAQTYYAQTGKGKATRTATYSSTLCPGAMPARFTVETDLDLTSWFLVPLLKDSGHWIPSTFPIVSADPGVFNEIFSLDESGIASVTQRSWGFLDDRNYAEEFQKEVVDLNTGKVSYRFAQNVSDQYCGVTSITRGLDGYVEVTFLPGTRAASLSFLNPYASIADMGSNPGPVTPATATAAPSASSLSADGKSAAVVVYRSASQDPVKLDLGANSSSRLSSYDPNFLISPSPGGSTNLDVPTPTYCDNTGTCFFLALLWGPDSFPVSASDLAAGAFPNVPLTVTASVSSGKPVQATLELMPPPVVLVHGLWSGPSAWTASTQHGLGPSFFSWLGAHYPHTLILATDYASSSFLKFSDPSVQSAMKYNVQMLLGSAAQQGMVARSVDVVAHSMGGLVARWFEAFPPDNLHDTVHRLITLGTPHQGSPLAAALWDNKTNKVISSSTLVNGICSGLNFVGTNCTLGNVFSWLGKPIDTGVLSLEPVNPDLTKLGATARAIAGQVSGPNTRTQKFLDKLASSFIPNATDEGLLQTTKHDTIVPVGSQIPLSAGDAVTIAGVVHTAIDSADIGETSSTAVWDQVLYFLMGGSGATTFSSPAYSAANRIEGASAGILSTSSIPDFDLSGKTQISATNVSFGPATNSALSVNTPINITATSTTKSIAEVFLIQNGGAASDVAVLSTADAPFSLTFFPTNLGAVDFVAFVVFNDNSYAVVPLHYTVQTVGTLALLTLSNAPTESVAPGTVMTIRAIAQFDSGPVEVTGLATYKSRSQSATVFSAAASGRVAANSAGLDWLDVSYGGQAVSTPIRVGGCSYQLGPANQIVPSSGGTASIQVVAPAGCTWNAAISDPWITGTTLSGTGNGTIAVRAAANSTGNGSRIAFVALGDQNAAITQADQACNYAISATRVNVAASGGVGSLDVTTSCPITAASSANWLSATNLGAKIAYYAEPNPSTASRTAMLTIGTQAINVMQAGAVPQTMALSRSSLNFGIAGSLTTSAQTVSLTFANGIGAGWTASSNKNNISVSPQSGIGNAILQIAATVGSSGIVTVTAVGASNSPQQIQVNVGTVLEGAPFGSFDTPANNTVGISSAVAVTGWALDNVEVSKVDLWREPVSGEGPGGGPNGLVYIGDAGFVADARPDVQAANPTAPLDYRAGWGYLLLTNFLPNSVGSGALGNGTYKLHAIAHNKAGIMFDLGTRTITVDNVHTSKPFGTIDTPTQGGTISGNAYVNFGWSLTQNPFCIPSDGSTITVYIDGQALPGHPVYNNKRNDIATLFPGLCNSNGAIGYYIIDTTQLTNGVHTIFWISYDDHNRGDGLGSRYFNVFNTGTTAAAPPEDEPIAPADVKSLKPGKDGVINMDAEELGRIEMHLGAMSGYSEVGGERAPLPIGSSLKRGTFYWHLGPGFTSTYSLVFQRRDGVETRVRVRVVPKKR